jgi:tetratricopeptide (TPR) repeat protein
MKRKFEELRENLDEFVEQAEYPMLVVGCVSEELAYVCKFLQALEEKHPEHYFVIFPHPFVNADGYVHGIVENLMIQIEAANIKRAERGEPPFPPLPPDLADRRRMPENRLRSVLEYLRGLLPNEKDHYVVVGLLPLECKNQLEYVRLVQSVMPSPDVEPWMVPLRIVVYDDRSQKVIVRAMSQAKIENVLTFEVDFSTPALTDALSRDAADTSLPEAERMACVMQLAALDYSYKRYPEALKKYGILNNYYADKGIPSMQALCLLGAGDTLQAGGQPAAAKEMMQRGIALAMEHKVLAVLLNALISIFDVCMSLGHHEDAESYADSGTKVAAGVLNPFAYADLFEKKGDAQLAQGKTGEGFASYLKCKELCKTYEYFYRWKSVLGKEAHLYEQARMGKEQRETEQQLALVEELERRGGQAGIKKQAEEYAAAQQGGAPAPAPARPPQGVRP